MDFPWRHFDISMTSREVRLPPLGGRLLSFPVPVTSEVGARYDLPIVGFRRLLATFGWLCVSSFILSRPKHCSGDPGIAPKIGREAK